VGRRERSAFDAWVRDEVLLCALLGGGLALFAGTGRLRSTYDLPAAHLVLETAVALACFAVAVLAAVRFRVEGRRVDLLLGSGFAASGATVFLFEVAPLLGGGVLQRPEAWAGVGGRLLAATLIACAAFARGQVKSWTRAGGALVLVAGALALLWSVARLLDGDLPALVPAVSDRQPSLLTAALAVEAMLSLLALVGFANRFRTAGADLDRWLAFAATLSLFAELHYVFTPLLSSSFVSQGDVLRLLSDSVLLAGVARAIRAAEFGRAVAEERARVAREIHDGLAQYLFAISTTVNMLEHGGDVSRILPRLKEAAAAAQQEARFAVLALSSASGNAPFDSALRRYVEFLTADGELEVEFEIDGSVRLGPDEQIELFRIVQEGLANVRRHAGARRAVVRIGELDGRRRVTIDDDGRGFDETSSSGGQGLKNIRARAVSIGGAFRLSSTPERGTSLEVVLRA